jgi:hypothetical protein
VSERAVEAAPPQTGDRRGPRLQLQLRGPNWCAERTLRLIAADEGVCQPLAISVDLRQEPLSGLSCLGIKYLQ